MSSSVGEARTSGATAAEKSGAEPAGPLSGLTVLDLTEHMAGPFCSMILADMGADVIKLERPGVGDSSRRMGDGSPRNAYFRYINRNKKSITLDYKHPQGKAACSCVLPNGRMFWSRTTGPP